VSAPLQRSAAAPAYDAAVRIVAVTNIKGGVGKTTTAVNLAYLAAAAGTPTVLWDLDPQGAASFVLRTESRPEASAKRLVSGKLEATDLLVPTLWPDLYVVPASLSYRNFDVHLSERKHRTERLLQMVRPLREACELLVMDCPPGISLLSENVLRAADAVVVPVIPSPLSLRMVEQLQEFVSESGWGDLLILPFFSMVDHRKSLHAEVIRDARARLPGLLATEVPYWSDIERMTARRAPLPAYAPRSSSAQIYLALWREIEAALPPA
jgi:cellulose biosynthesis protein BcsQ